jgi:4-amino-4-deoxy-L-arabinose transferase-like glycosyltransferase
MKKDINNMINKKNGIYSYSLTSPALFALFLFLLLMLISLTKAMNNDEGMWSYIGRVWSENGIPPYLGTVENKTPGIFEFFALSNILFGVNLLFARLVGVAVIVFSALLIFNIGNKLHSRNAGVISMYIFGLTTTWGLLDGECVSQTESFMILFSTLSFYFVLKGKDQKHWKALNLLAGISIGLAIAFKQIAIMTTIALVIFVIIYVFKDKPRRDLFIALILIITGIVISTLLSIVPLLLSGVTLKDYYDGAWMILLNPGSSANSPDRLYGFFRVWFNSRMVVFYAAFILLVFQRDIVKNKFFIALIIWLFFDFMGVNAAGTYFGHQLKQIIPSLSLIVGILLANILAVGNPENIENTETKNVSKIILVLILILFPYQDVVINGYLKGYPENDKKLGLWLKEKTNPDDYIYVLARSGNPVLSYSERISSSKYFNSFFVTGEKEKKQVLSDLNAKPPVYILWNTNKAFPGNEIEEYIRNNYSFLESRDAYKIYKRNE